MAGSTSGAEGLIPSGPTANGRPVSSGREASIKATMDSTSIIIGVISGSIGLGYFMYGKKRSKIVPFISGIGLCVVPYAIDNSTLLILACLALMIAPLIIKL